MVRIVTDKVRGTTLPLWVYLVGDRDDSHPCSIKKGGRNSPSTLIVLSSRLLNSFETLELGGSLSLMKRISYGRP